MFRKHQEKTTSVAKPTNTKTYRRRLFHYWRIYSLVGQSLFWERRRTPFSQVPQNCSPFFASNNYHSSTQNRFLSLNLVKRKSIRSRLKGISKVNTLNSKSVIQIDLIDKKKSRDFCTKQPQHDSALTHQILLLRGRRFAINP